MFTCPNQWHSQVSWKKNMSLNLKFCQILNPSFCAKHQLEYKMNDRESKKEEVRINNYCKSYRILRSRHWKESTATLSYSKLYVQNWKKASTNRRKKSQVMPYTR